MDITNSRRILALGAPDAGVLALLKDLTGSSPTPVDSTTAGLLHTWKLETQYYRAELSIWIDEIVDLEAWRAEFVKPEAKEVVSALGAWIFCFRKPISQEELGVIKESIRAIADVIRKACGYSWDGTCLAVGMPQGITPHFQLDDEEWEEFCRELGFEYVDATTKGRNDFGEPTGVDRVKEALETTEWDGADDDFGDILSEDDLDGTGDNDESEWGAFSVEEAEMNMELLGMKTAVNGGNVGEEEDEALQVEELERMMGKLQAIRDTSSSMPEAERKRFAAKAVAEVMKTL
ncbi:hypothetical protein FKW77_006857 [Venturia effusa]|uniref:Increased recombination centers protein 6 n=1 Tax=Venturia effusa TaxID=50376 RepID=A0A517LPA1_9PEZI|nr:hypothetical protein FKW77_006857 [Venturia effusa]